MICIFRKKKSIYLVFEFHLCMFSLLRTVSLKTCSFITYIGKTAMEVIWVFNIVLIILLIIIRKKCPQRDNTPLKTWINTFMAQWIRVLRREQSLIKKIFIPKMLTLTRLWHCFLSWIVMYILSKKQISCYKKGHSIPVFIHCSEIIGQTGN